MGGGCSEDPSQWVDFLLWWLKFGGYQYGICFVNFLAPQNIGVVPGFFLGILCTLYTNLHGVIFQKPLIFKIHQHKNFQFL